MSKTTAWQQYEKGIDYKSRIGLYSTVDLNERFYAGDQWAGIPHEGLPTPVVNFIKYASAWKIAAVTDRRLELAFFAEGENDGQDIGTYAKQISDYCGRIWERLKMDYLTKEGLKQAAITGDYIQYFYWDNGINTGQALKGDIATMLIDNVNYYPGNPNDADVQNQPYIIIAFRELLSKVKEEAKAGGCKQIDEIKADEENEYTLGDRGKIELDDDGKCNVLLKMWKEDGKVFCEKTTRNVVIVPKKDSKLTRYPVALMNWETRSNSCHGVAEVTGLIPNQVYVNKILALSQLSQVQVSFPKVIFDKTRIKQWSNKVAGAIPVSGDIMGAAQYITPPGVSYDAWKGMDTTIDQTMRMMGANDVTLGNISNPDNTSAFIATRDAAMIPLQTQQERFYSMVEDIGLVWLDFIQSFYKAGRKIPVEDEGKRTFVPLPDNELEKFTMNLKVDVGPSSMWSEIQVLQTLDNLLANGQITLKQYLERIPDGHIPSKDKLLEEVSAPQGAGGSLGGGAPALGGGLQGGLPIGNGVPATGGSSTGELTKGNGAPATGGGGMSSGLPMGDNASAMEGLPVEMPADAGAPVADGAAQDAPVEMSEEELANMMEGISGKPTKASGKKAVPKKKTARSETSKTKKGAGGSGDSKGVIALIKKLAKKGDIPQDVAQAVAALEKSGVGVDAVLAAVKNAAAQGQISGDVVQQIEAEIG